MVQILAVIGLGLGIFGTASAQSYDPVAATAVSAAAPVHKVIARCDDSISVCASQFEKIVTVYEHDVTSIQTKWVTTNVTLPTTTITSTVVTIEKRYNKTEIDALCEKTFVVTLPGTSTVTVQLNSTHINKIIPTTTTSTTSTITQYETEVSVCLVQGTHQFPLRPRNNGQQEEPVASSAAPSAGSSTAPSAAPTAVRLGDAEAYAEAIPDPRVEQADEDLEDEDGGGHDEL
ncbi:hypothetical protein B0T26DRAFT_701876 [Lasiosphaeria miniovina]|uniref:Uncharacterized protein n=1 Tax=Lasiosphaeria miniovina TaxID=1954250 RepID=A0AA40E4H4_9PEZI|nr:uncharacterized protein B0T26DRAFT_701876 [Lasiosphaeria miniovina]KAK0722223.1 hypothetical protein B0T26DRAFT_701876 [Lasiosphaeria miniovina]